MTIGNITHAKSASDVRTSAVATTNPGAPVVDTITNDDLITTAAGLASALSITTTSHATQNAAAREVASVFAMTCGVARFTRDAKISEREEGAIENTVASARGCVAATS